MPYENPTNIGNFVELLNYTNNITTLTDTSGTVVATNMFGLLIILAIWIVVYMSINVNWSAIKSIATASWLTSIISLGFVVIGILDMEMSIIIFVISFLSTFLLFLDNDKNEVR